MNTVANFCRTKSFTDEVSLDQAVEVALVAIEVGQKVGAFDLLEAYALTESMKAVKEKKTDASTQDFQNLLVGLNKTQRHGSAFSLEDIAFVFPAAREIGNLLSSRQSDDDQGDK